MKIKRQIKNSILLFILNLFATTSFAQIPLVYEVENTGASCTAPPLPAVAQLTSYAMLPDPFAWSNGSGRIASFADWSCRRNEIKREIEQYEIGVKPPKPANITATYTGGVLTVRVTENGKTLTLTSNVTMPTGTGPFPVVIGMNARTGQLPTNLFNGVIQIPFNHDQVAKYTQGDRDPSYPFFQLYPNLTSNGYYSAWAWGISRLIDGIELVQAQLNADTKRIAVTGCSYAGKMALFAGAFDERIALTIAQESGGGGVNAWRVSETIGNVEKISNTNYAWFMQSLKTNFQNGNAVKLPYDHHELMAMIAPRALLVLGNPPFEWLGDESGYVSSRAAQEVWTTLGVPERFGFSFRGGHDHCSLPSASNAEVTAFVDKFLRNSTTANTNIAVHSFPNTDYNKWIAAWKGYVLPPVNTNSPAVTVTAPATNASYAEGEPITITATATPKTGTITQVEFYQGTTLLGTDATAPYTFTWANAPAGKYQITAKATTSASHAGTSAAITVLVTKAIFQTGAAPAIDGIVDAAWSNYTAVPITNILSGTVSSAADLSGNWKAMWDATNLYVLVQVTDDVKRNDAGTDVYNDDGVEIYFDFGNNKPTAYGANDHQYTFRWNDATAAYEINGHSVAGITKGSTNTTGGYIMEVRIPWVTIGGVPAANSLHGFDVMINDDDNGAARDKKIAWTATADDTWNNPSLMGTIVLKGLDCTPPAATITATGATTVCSGTSVTLNANAGTGFTYIWKKDVTVISGATAASYAATTSGSYTVTVTSGACAATSTATLVTVNTAPAAPTVAATVAYCQNEPAAVLTATGTGLKWYTAATGGASTNVLTPETGTAGSRNYYVSQTTNGCESARAVIAVTIHALPAATITAGSPTTFCTGGSVLLTASTGSSYVWKRGATLVGTAATYTAAESGSYTVEVTNAATCKAVSTATAVTVTTAPAAPAVAATVAYCQNETAGALTAAGSGLKWYTAATGGTSAAALIPETGTAGSRNYYVSQTTNGCESARAVIAVTIHTLPAATITASGSTAILPGSSVLLNANTGTGFAYKWFRGTTQLSTASAYAANTAGAYTVEVTNANDCKAVSAAMIVTSATNQPSVITITSPLPDATIKGAITISADISDADGAIARVEFLDGTTVIGTTAAAPYTFVWNTPGAGEHSITVRVTDQNGGVTTSAPVTITSEQITTAVQSANSIQAFVYPNPSAGEVFIETETDLSTADFTAVDVLGKEVSLSAMVTGNGATVDLSNLSGGTYVLLVRDGNSILRKKITLIK